MRRCNEQWGVFWCSLLPPVFFGETDRAQTNQFLQSWYGKALPKSTLYRVLKQAGTTRIKLGISSRLMRRRWSRDQTRALWLGDFEEDPYVLHEQ